MNIGEFKSLLDRYLKRVDLRDLYDDWINFTQLRINSQLRLQEQEYRAITTPTSQYVALPPDYIEMRHIETSADNGRPLRYKTPDQIDGLNNAYQSGRVLFYTIINNQLELIPSPTADSVATLEMFYYAKLAAFTGDNQTDKVLTAYPNLYLYGCMMEAAAFRINESDAQSYSQLWVDYAKQLNDRQQAGRYGSNVQMGRPR